jgi:hypothetical protein
VTPQEARGLAKGDRIQSTLPVIDSKGGTVRGLILKVTRVRTFSGPLGTPGRVSIDVMDDEGREGTIQEDFIVAFARLPGSEPTWWGELMGHEGPLD